MKTLNYILVAVSVVLLAVACSCGASSDKPSSVVESASPVSMPVEKTEHEQLLSEGWSYLGIACFDIKLSNDWIGFSRSSCKIYFKDGHYTVTTDWGYGHVRRYPMKKGSYRLYDGDDKYTYNGKFVIDRDEYYLNF